MENVFPQWFYKGLKALAASSMVGVALLLVMLSVFAIPLRDVRRDVRAVGGAAQVEGDLYSGAPVRLDGEWERFPGIFFSDTAPYDAQLLQSPELVQLPILKLSQAKGTATYRLLFKHSARQGTERLALYIPDTRGEINIFLNGNLKLPFACESTWVDYNGFHTIVFLDELSGSLEYQELVISVNENPVETALYKRPVILGAPVNLITLASSTAGNDMLLLGIALMIIINGFVFMFFRPQENLTSFIALFDTMIIARLLFGLKGTFSFFGTFFPWLALSDRACTSLSIFFLMMGGISGIVLSHLLFDPDSVLPDRITKIPMYGYAVCAVIFTPFPELFETWGIYIIYIFVVLTFMGVLLQFRVCLGRHPSRYLRFQMCKTVYLGAIILIDILHFNKITSIIDLVYFYSIVFFIHVVQRLYDSNSNYRAVEVLNQNLESTVAQRTRELSEANRTLSEMTVRDPLTKAYNRLYFEQMMERYITSEPEARKALHIAMLDLDHFKLVNDRFGHEAGDEQLQALVKLITAKIDSESFLARIGGEEFVIMFFGQTIREAQISLENIRGAMEKMAKQNPQFTTASFGLATFQPEDTTKTLLGRADSFLYKAKNNGRNRVECAE